MDEVEKPSVVIEHNNLRKTIVVLLLIITLLILFWILFFGIERGDVVGYLIAIFFFLPIVKFLESYLVLSIRVNFDKQVLSFRRSFGRVIIRKSNVESWGIRRVGSGIMSSLVSSQQFIELHLKNGKTFIYPLIQMRTVFPRHSFYSDKYYENIFERALGIKAVQYKNIGATIRESGLTSFRYDFSFILL